jgi:succinate-semialdehyde dehydrogenase/glutarate-semialdehyde dehydrogenase
MKVGPGIEDGVGQGPLIDMAAVEKIEEHVKDAIAKGGPLAVSKNPAWVAKAPTWA